MAGWLSMVWQVLQAQRGHLFPWVPVVFSCGIAGYFTLPVEPAFSVLCGLMGVGLGMAVAVVWLPETARPLALAIALVLLGAGWAGLRAHYVSAPVLKGHYYGPITGQLVAIDRSASHALRLTLRDVVLARRDARSVPDRVRVSLHGEWHMPDLQPGQVVQMTGHLSPPGGAVEPGGFDFRRHAWFLRLGAVGYTRTPVMILMPHQGKMPVARARWALSERVQNVLSGQAGAFAAAVITGDRSGLSPDVLRHLRQTNIAHLLAISGLHMGLLVGTVFAALRLALVGLFGDRLRAKKLAAAVALVPGAGYLALSGGNVATERAFIMVAVVLVGVLLDRRALTFRAVAFAAMLVLLLRPEALLSPGFQMSFAATSALVAVLGAVRPGQGRLRRWGVSLVLTSAVAGLATAPYSMAHFNQVSHYGLLANLLTVPLMGLLVMPFGLIAVLLMPFGLEAVPLWVMGWGLEWILTVAATVSSWPGAVGAIMAPPAMVLPILTLGACFVLLWQGRLRWAGAVPVIVAGALWMTGVRPAILVAEGGGLVGVMTAEGRAVSRPKGDSFVAKIWLENDGQGLGRDQSSSLWDGGLPGRVGARLIHVHGKRSAAAFLGCQPGDLVVTSEPLPATGCTTIGPKMLKQTGAIAIIPESGGLRISSAAQMAGRRLWAQRSVSADQPNQTPLHLNMASR
ncbi:ComEC/Rec2 family competence protein [Pseudoprimorskyibacter insulae]|uniref:ComE operon protein 3 n=1 Tax=Pseudoprimorskyibacter insulae TaxID=1695997 RepID=A0A2R8AXI1_9RHOB|nr:ComEC/Rec2 family competence protein [Pseudoprimorskyibacter insulae]SPF80733.1 ComE operon protein 3 [Pseudoprimorskyibacter insulae]